MDLGPLFRLHDKEMWPNRTWGDINPNWMHYLTLEANRLFHVLAVRNAACRLVGYCGEVLMMDNHYGVPTSLCDMLFIHPEYRGGEGMVSAGYRLLREREKMLDELKIVRRLIRPKHVKMFGPILERMGYEQVAYEFQKIGETKP